MASGMRLQAAHRRGDATCDHASCSLLDVAGVDLVERAVVPGLVAAVVGHPVAGLAVGVEQPVGRDVGGHGGATAAGGQDGRNSHRRMTKLHGVSSLLSPPGPPSMRGSCFSWPRPGWGLRYTPEIKLSQARQQCKKAKDLFSNGRCARAASRWCRTQSRRSDSHAAATVDTQPSRRSTCTLRLSPDRHQWQKCSQLLLAMR